MKMMPFIGFIHKYKLKNKATSNIKIYQVFFSIGLDNVDINLRNGPFSSDIGIVKLHPSKRTHWVAYITEKYFDSYGCWFSQKLSKFIIKRNGFCFYSEYKIQGLAGEKDSYCAKYCFYIIHLTLVSRTDFKFAVLNLYFQMIQKCWRFFKINDIKKKNNW